MKALPIGRLHFHFSLHEECTAIRATRKWARCTLHEVKRTNSRRSIISFHSALVSAARRPSGHRSAWAAWGKTQSTSSFGIGEGGYSRTSTGRRCWSGSRRRRWDHRRRRQELAGMGGMLRAGMGVVVVVPSEAAVTPPSKERADVLLRVFCLSGNRVGRVRRQREVAHVSRLEGVREYCLLCPERGVFELTAITSVLETWEGPGGWCAQFYVATCFVCVVITMVLFCYYCAKLARLSAPFGYWCIFGAFRTFVVSVDSTNASTVVSRFFFWCRVGLFEELFAGLFLCPRALRSPQGPERFAREERGAP